MKKWAKGTIIYLDLFRYPCTNKTTLSPRTLSSGKSSFPEKWISHSSLYYCKPLPLHARQNISCHCCNLKLQHLLSPQLLKTTFLLDSHFYVFIQKSALIFICCTYNQARRCRISTTFSGSNDPTWLHPIRKWSFYGQVLKSDW